MRFVSEFCACRARRNGKLCFQRSPLAAITWYSAGRPPITLCCYSSRIHLREVFAYICNNKGSPRRPLPACVVVYKIARMHAFAVSRGNRRRGRCLAEGCHAWFSSVQSCSASISIFLCLVNTDLCRIHSSLYVCTSTLRCGGQWTPCGVLLKQRHKSLQLRVFPPLDLVGACARPHAGQ